MTAPQWRGYRAGRPERALTVREALWYQARERIASTLGVCPMDVVCVPWPEVSPGDASATRQAARRR